MAITSKPSDGDSIVEARAGALGGVSYVSSRQFLIFLDDLINNIDSVSPLEHSDGQTSANIYGIKQGLDSLKKQLSSRISAVESYPKTQNHVKIKTTSQQDSQLIADLSMLKNEISAIKKKLRADEIGRVYAELNSAKSEIELLKTEINKIKQVI